jgi:hypothetical protein
LLTKNYLCEIWGFHREGARDLGLLESDSVLFQRSSVPSCETKAERYSETSGTVTPMTQHHIRGALALPNMRLFVAFIILSTFLLILYSSATIRQLSQHVNKKLNY